MKERGRGALAVSNLERAIEIAARAHEGQVDKGGRPYILHPIRVMLKMQSPAEQIVAILHDVLEDTSTTTHDLYQAGFSREIVEAIQALTKAPGESRIEAAQRAATNPIARNVKLADNLDNSDPSRIPNPSEKDRARLLEYAKVRDLLVQSGAKVGPVRQANGQDSDPRPS